MKNCIAIPATIIAIYLLPLFNPRASAAIFQVVSNGASYNALDGFIMTNLLQAGQSSLSSVETSHGPASGWIQSGLNDGYASATSGDQAGDTHYDLGTLPVTITFNLNTNNLAGGSASGYDLNTIQCISGWNGGYYSDQNFQLLLSLNGGPFNFYGNFNASNPLNGGNNSILNQVVSGSGPIARGVTAVQFVFATINTGNGTPVIHELQAFGTPSPTNAIPAPYRICAVGDSITSGYEDPPAWTVPFQFGFRSGLMELLASNGMSFQFVGGSSQPWGLTDGTVTNIPSPDLRIAGQDHFEGYSGKTSAFVLGNISAWLAADQPDVVLLMIGINDIAQGSSGEPTGTEQNLSNIVATVVGQSPNTRLIVAQITPYATYTDSITRYNKYIAGTLVPYFAGLGRHVSTVNQYTNLCVAGATNIDSGLFANGSSHPTPAAYNRMAQTWFNGIKALSLPTMPQPTTANPNLVINGGFEVPIFTTTSHNVCPQGSGWGFTIGYNSATGAAIDKGQAYGAGGANSYDGTQRGALHSSGNSTVIHLSQAVSGFTAGQFYQLSFWSEAIAAAAGANPFHVSIINGASTNLLAINGSTNAIVPPINNYQQYTSAPFQASNTVMTLDFADNGLADSDHVSWIDGVGIYAVSNINLLINGSFEVPDYVNGSTPSHNINPTGTGWLFTQGANSGCGSGIDRNDPYGNSGSIQFDGAQQAVLQGGNNGTVMSISQTVTSLTVGKYYQLSFAAKAISGSSGANPFQVKTIFSATTNLLFGGSDILPVASGYTLYTSQPFQATNSVMTLTFADHAVDNNHVSWIDAVSLYAVPMPQLTLPTFGTPTIVAGNLVLTGTGGTRNSTYTWLTTTNLSPPITWTTNITGTLDGTGAFSNIIPIRATTPANFFRLRLP